MRDRGVVAWLMVAALVAVLPYLALGYAGHDLRFHVASWMELRDAWASGHLDDGWAAKANFGLGDPHLLYYPPVSFWLGAGLALVLPFRVVPGLFAYTCVLAAGLAMWHASRWFVGVERRFGAALLYMLSPYLMTTSLVRFSAGELVVQAVLPLVLVWFYRGALLGERRAWVLLGAALGVGWLANLPASVVILWGLGPVAGWWAWRTRTVRGLWRFVAAEAVGGLLGAFYLLPLWWERRWFSGDDLFRVGPRQLLLFMPRSMPKVPNFFYASCWVLALAGAGLVLFAIWGRWRGVRGEPVLMLGVWVSAVAFFWQLPVTLGLWEHLPGMRYVLFPYRFLMMMGVGLPLVVMPAGVRVRRVVYWVVGMLVLIPLGQYVRTQTLAVSREGRLAERLAAWRTVGYAGVPEWVPAGARVDDEAGGLPGLEASAGCVVVGTAKEFMASSANGCRVVVPILFYPYWRAVGDGGQRLAAAVGPDGRMVVVVPGGMRGVRLAFVARSGMRVVGLGVSLVGLVGWVMAFLGWGTRQEQATAEYGDSSRFARNDLGV